MDEEKEQILKEIEAKTEEIRRLNMRTQIFTEVISHLRSRISKAETRKREIHNEILDLRGRVIAWMQTKRKD